MVLPAAETVPTEVTCLEQTQYTNERQPKRAAEHRQQPGSGESKLNDHGATALTCFPGGTGVDLHNVPAQKQQAGTQASRHGKLIAACRWELAGLPEQNVIAEEGAWMPAQPHERICGSPM